MHNLQSAGKNHLGCDARRIERGSGRAQARNPNGVRAGSRMRSPIKRLVPLLAILAGAPLASATTFTPPVTPPTSENSPALPSPATSARRSPTSVPSPTAPSRTPEPNGSPEAATNGDPTPVETSDVERDEARTREMPASEASATSLPIGVVRTFRTPERAAAPAFVAPHAEVPTDAGDTQPDDLETESMAPPDEPYIATVTFRAVASTAVDGFDLLVIYPHAAGDFVGSRNGVDCRQTGNATLFADDHEDGTLRILVAGRDALTFPFDVVCRFTVAPNASLTSRLIAVNVVEVSVGGERSDPSVLTVSVSAR